MKTEPGNDSETAPGAVGFTGRVLSGATSNQKLAPVTAMEQQRSKAEKDIISKLRPSTYVPEFKPPERTTYREFILGMTKVLEFVINVSGSADGYAAHMAFIASKGACNYFVTESLIRYELAVTDKVIDGTLTDWVGADPKSVAMHLGADATYAVRGGNRPSWNWASRGNFGHTRDYSDWPKEVC